MTSVAAAAAARRDLVLLLFLMAARAPSVTKGVHKRGLRWAVNFPDTAQPFLLGHNPHSWANTTLSVANATVGIVVGPVRTAAPCATRSSPSHPLLLAGVLGTRVG
jgi:hypothetical protein